MYVAALVCFLYSVTISSQVHAHFAPEPLVVCKQELMHALL